MTWYTGANRVERLQHALDARRLDAILALTPENAEYLSGRYNYIATHWRIPGLFTAIVGRNGDRAIVTGDFGGDPRTASPVREFIYRIWTEVIDVRDQPAGPIADRVRAARPCGLDRPAQFDLEEIFDRIAEALSDTATEPSRVGLEMNVLPADTIGQLQRRLPHVEFVEAGDILDDLRALKDPDEIRLLRLACELTEAGIGGAISRLRPGLSTAAVNSLYQIAVHEQVIADPRFAAFRQAEGSASIGLGADSPGVVAPGQTVKFDMQVDIGGYHSDVGRTVAFEPTEDQRTVYAALRGALAEAQDAIRPGVTFAAIHAAGTGAMHGAGFSNYSRGHLGHSVGLTQNFEEAPFIASDEHQPVMAGMMLSLELPYYVYGIGAFQLERMILVSESGHEAIDKLPFELALAG